MTETDDTSLASLSAAGDMSGHSFWPRTRLPSLSPAIYSHSDRDHPPIGPPHATQIRSSRLTAIAR